jgi:hypothetical protein
MHSHCAISAYKEDLVQWLLNYDIDVVDKRYCWLEPSPLEAAVSRGNIGLAEVLINRGAHVTGYVLSAAVWEALGTENDDIVRRLLGSYSNLSCVRNAGATAVDMAVQQRNHGLVQFLLEAGIDPKGTPMHREPRKDDSTHHRAQAGWWHSYYYSLNQHNPGSVLETAARLGDRPMLQILLEATGWAQEFTGRALSRDRQP